MAFVHVLLDTVPEVDLGAIWESGGPEAYQEGNQQINGAYDQGTVPKLLSLPIWAQVLKYQPGDIHSKSYRSPVEVAEDCLCVYVG